MATTKWSPLRTKTLRRTVKEHDISYDISEKNFIELAFRKRDIPFSPVLLNQYLDELHLKN